jgi:hypothetical protein
MPDWLLRRIPSNLCWVTNAERRGWFRVGVRNRYCCVEKVLHTFMDAATDGANPQGNLTIDESGDLYGTTARGGTGIACGGGLRNHVQDHPIIFAASAG